MISRQRPLDAAIAAFLWAGGLAVFAVLMTGCDGALPPSRLAVQGLDVPRQIDVRDDPFVAVPNGKFVAFIVEDSLKIAHSILLQSPLPVNVPLAMHELKFVGVSEHAGPRSRDYLLQLLTDGVFCRSETSHGSSYIIRSAYGKHVVYDSADATGNRREAHFGQLVATLAEAAVPSGTTVVDDDGGVGNVSDLVNDLAMRYSNRAEQEIVAVSLASYLVPGCEWCNANGSDLSVDTVACNLAGKRIGKGACAGVHQLYAVAYLLSWDQECKVLRSRTRSLCRNLLKRVSHRLALSQDMSGGWDGNWWGDGDSERLWPGQSNNSMNSLSATGHHLEWIAIAPPDCCPEPIVVRRAIEGCVDLLKELRQNTSEGFKVMLPALHAARAIVLLAKETFSLNESIGTK